MEWSCPNLCPYQLVRNSGSFGKEGRKKEGRKGGISSRRAEGKLCMSLEEEIQKSQ